MPVESLVKVQFLSRHDGVFRGGHFSLAAFVLASIVAAQPAAAFFGSHYEQLYLDALSSWVEAPNEESAAELVDLENSAKGPKLNRLDEAEERMVKDLARIDPEALIPIAALHRMAYELHLEAGSLIGGRHSAQRLREVLNVYVKRSRTPEARAIAARQWTGLGLTLLAQGGRHLSPARACLSESLSHSKRRRDQTAELLEARIRALHIRAVVLERIGTPAKALDDLEDLLEIDPEHREARLRQAVNLMHAERVEEAEPKLRELAQLESPEWVAIVAAQQLTRLLLDQGRPGEAEEILRGSLERFPNNARLGILLAHQERPTWQSANARVANLLESWPKSKPIRPRARYEGPVEDDEVIRLTINKDLENHLDAARNALAELEVRRAQ